MDKRLYVIEELWIDPMENTIHSAVGYNIIGYIIGEENAKEFVDNGKIYNSADCWATYNTNQYRYTLINEICTDTNIVIVDKFCKLYKKECMGGFCSVTPFPEKCQYLDVTEIKNK